MMATPDLHRLNQWIAQATGMARRKVDEAIEAGRIRVNKKPAVLGQKIDPSKDRILLDGKPLQAKTRLTYIKYYKPKDVLCTRSDPEGRKTLYDVLPKEVQACDPVGRLDRQSTGLVLLTNDGQLLHRLSHPKFGHSKTYRVSVDKPLSDKVLQQLQQGIELQPEGKLAQCQVQSITDPVTVTLALKTGLNRQIRRMFEAVGYTVVKLKRLAIGPIHLGELKPGEWRNLSFREINALTKLPTIKAKPHKPSKRRP